MTYELITRRPGLSAGVVPYPKTTRIFVRLWKFELSVFVWRRA